METMNKRSAIVVGGSSGIGATCVTTLLEQGWEVCVIDRNPVPPELGSTASATADVRDGTAIANAFRELTAGRELAAVVDTAGLARVAPITDVRDEDWELVVGVNLTGAFNVLRAAAPLMSKEGSILLVSSIDGTAPVSGLAPYCAAKAGVDALARSAALELGPRGIRCNVIAPGAVRTPLVATLFDQPAVAREFEEHTPLGRIGTPEDVAEVAAFLVSPAARWITGARIPVDGGLSLREHPSLLRERAVDQTNQPRSSTA